MKKSAWFLLSILIIILDQFSKYGAASVLLPYQPLPVFPLLNITLAYNSGAAFSFLSGTGAWHLWFFTAFSVVVSLALIVWLLRTAREDRLQAAGIALILGGALGNLIDRAFYGYVIDFIDFHVGKYHFATFNLADAAICIGAVLLLLDAFIHPKRSAVELKSL